MIHFIPAAGSRRTTALLAAAAGAALWGAAMAAQAGDQAPQPQQPAADAHSVTSAKPDPDDRIVCRDEEAPTGSRLGAKRVCLTKRQWKQREQDGQDLMNDVDRGNLNSSRGK